MSIVSVSSNYCIWRIPTLVALLFYKEKLSVLPNRFNTP